MKKFSVAYLLLGVATLSGCTSMAIDRASNELADVCEERGPDMRIASPTAESRGGMFGNVVITGVCVAPEDDGYAEAMTIEDYRASIGKTPA